VTTLEIVLSVGGIVISAAGFATTIYQIRMTRTAVEASDASAKAALSAISQRLTISELADIRSGLKAVQTALRGDRFETALLLLQSILEQLHGLRSRHGFDGNERQAAIQSVVVRLAKLRNKLEARVSSHAEAFSVPRANNMLSEIGGHLSMWAEELRFVTESEG
jgi:hypothetical protein